MARDTSVQVNFRMPAVLKARLEEAASENVRSLTAEVTDRLQRSFTSDEIIADLRAQLTSAEVRENYLNHQLAQRYEPQHYLPENFSPSAPEHVAQVEKNLAIILADIAERMELFDAIGQRLGNIEKLVQKKANSILDVEMAEQEAAEAKAAEAAKSAEKPARARARRRTVEEL